ncbi:MAG TPA: TonB family protein [Pyrinomonadaceae bacterium]|nr:TonB family protein [Pyrinomonadaceae bacterium]
MKNLFALFIIGACLAQTIDAQKVLSSSPAAVVQAQTQTAAPQSAELAEADKLSAEAVKLYAAGKYDEALPPAKNALKIREKELGSDHPLVAVALSNLAGILMAKREVKDAEALYRRALAIYEKKYGGNDLHVSKALDSLAAAETAKGDYEKAQDFSERSFSIKEKALGTENPQYLKALESLAAFYMFRGKYDKAAPLYERAAAIREKKLGATNPQLGAALEHWACALYRNNQPGEADKIETRANNILYKEAAARAEPIPLSYSAFNCRIINIPQPRLPAAAMRGKTKEMTVSATVTVDENGKVANVQFVGGDAIYNRALQDAIQQARFRPMSVDGHPVKVTGEIRYRFGEAGPQEYAPNSYGATIPGQ